MKFLFIPFWLRQGLVKYHLKPSQCLDPAVMSRYFSKNDLTAFQQSAQAFAEAVRARYDIDISDAVITPLSDPSIACIPRPKDEPLTYALTGRTLRVDEYIQFELVDIPVGDNEATIGVCCSIGLDQSGTGSCASLANQRFMDELIQLLYEYSRPIEAIASVGLIHAYINVNRV